MRKWLRTVFRGPTLVAALVAAVATGVSIRLAPAGGDGPGPVIYQRGDAGAPETGSNITAVEVGRHGTASVHHFRIAEGVKAHVHRQHDEQVVVLGGEGTAKVGEATHPVAAGTVVVIPRGTVHQLTVTGEPVEAVSIFSPPFDGEDRHFVE
jgi:mannose-6-phosphate isomerase-like protein (cupin superfamily)